VEEAFYALSVITDEWDTVLRVQPMGSLGSWKAQIFLEPGITA